MTEFFQIWLGLLLIFTAALPAKREYFGEVLFGKKLIKWTALDPTLLVLGGGLIGSALK